MEPLRLRHSRGETPIFLGRTALADAATVCASWFAGQRLVVVTTPRVRGLQGERIAPLARLAAETEWLEVEEGEAAKNVATAERLWRRLAEARADRSVRLLAFGGGSVGDLTGFVAATFLRGVAWAQAPTTVLAQVDASIGGKTAIDLPEAKNAVGSIHQPDLVISDLAVLDTLPVEERRAGLVEAVKVAFATDAPSFSRLEEVLPDLVDGRPDALEAAIRRAASLKIAVVERDPEDRSSRQVLNLGHTLGHAMESVLGYRGLRHGEAVAYGMLFVLRPAVRRGLAPVAARRLSAAVRRLVPPPLPQAARDPALLLAAMSRDKKSLAGRVRWVLPAAVGESRWGVEIPDDEILGDLGRFLDDPWRDPAE